MKKTLLIIIFGLINISTFAQNQADIDPTFNTGTGFNGRVETTHIQSDGKILVGGDFSSYNGTAARGIIRLNTDGTADTSFNVGTGFNNGLYAYTVRCIKTQSDGKIVVGGNFNSYNGTTNVNCIARLNIDGSLDTVFADRTKSYIQNNNNGTRIVYDIEILTNGLILVAGNFNDDGNLPRGFKMFASDGLTPYYSHFAVPYGIKRTIEVQSDGKILLGGAEIQRYIIGPGTTLQNYSFSVDYSFTTYPAFLLNTYATDMKIQTDGKLVVVGNFFSVNATAVNKIARFSAEGVFDNSLVTMPTPSPFDAILSLNHRSGKLLVGGGGSSAGPFKRLNADGSLDNPFNTGIGTGFSNTVNSVFSPVVTCLSVQSDGKIIVGGFFNLYQGTIRNHIVRLKGATYLSTNDFTKQTISLYPNPVKDILNLSLPENTNIENYEIYDLLGKKVMFEKTAQSIINVSELCKGIYVIKVFAIEGIFTNKFIKQ